MENKKILPISIIALSISIVFGAIWIGQSIEKIIDIKTSGYNVSAEKALLTDAESAEYLNISLDEFNNILLKNSREKANLTSYDTYKFIPYIEINDNKKMFSKKELDEWIKYNSLNK